MVDNAWNKTLFILEYTEINKLQNKKGNRILYL